MIKKILGIIILLLGCINVSAWTVSTINGTNTTVIYDSNNAPYDADTLANNAKNATNILIWMGSNEILNDIPFQPMNKKFSDLFTKMETITIHGGTLSSNSLGGLTTLKCVNIYTDVSAVKVQAFNNDTSIVSVNILKADNELNEGKINCNKDAFDYRVTDGQTDINNSYAKLTVYEDASLEILQYYCGNPVVCDPSLQESRMKYRNSAANGFQQFINNNGTVTVKGGTFRTFSSCSDIIFPKDGDQNSEKGLSAYIVTGYKDNCVILQQLNKDKEIVVSKNTGVLVWCSGTEFLYNEYANTDIKDAQKLEVNYLEPMCNKTDYTIKPYEKEGSEVKYRNFFLCKASDTDKGLSYWTTDNIDYWAFFRASKTGINKVNYAYLHFPSNIYTDSEGGEASFSTGNEIYWNTSTSTTLSKGLMIYSDNTTEIAKISNTVSDDKYYTLMGVCISKPTQRGIYIHNGKKFYIK